MKTAFFTIDTVNCNLVAKGTGTNKIEVNADLVLNIDDLYRLKSQITDALNNLDNAALNK